MFISLGDSHRDSDENSAIVTFYCENIFHHSTNQENKLMSSSSVQIKLAFIYQLRRILATFIPHMPLFGRKIRIANAVFLLSAAIPMWLVTEAIAPQVVQAYTARVDLAIDRLPGDNYQSLLRRAEAVARAAAQRSFDKDILVSDVSIIISVQNYGAIAPVLELNVNREHWRTRPDPQRWATYFRTARSLLYFGQKAATNAEPTQEAPTNPTQSPDPEILPTPEP